MNYLKSPDPHVSIIIPTYNRGYCIGRTIDSVRSQTIDNWELLIVDDGSTDNTEEIIRSFLPDDRIKFYQRPGSRPAGGSSARNFGFELSKGQCIKWLDSDDLLAPECLEKQLEKMTTAKCDVCFCKSELFTAVNEENILSGKLWSRYEYTYENVVVAYLKGQVRWSVSSGLWKRDIIGDRPFDEVLRSSQEWLMILRALLKKPRICQIDEVLDLIRVHDKNMPASRRLAPYLRNQICGRMLASNALRKSMYNNRRLQQIIFKVSIALLFRFRKSLHVKETLFSIGFVFVVFRNLLLATVNGR